MAIRFIHRIQRLVAADAHGFVESLEDRALLLKQHLREAELELQRKRARVEALAEEERRVGETARRLEEALGRAEQDTRLALAEQRDDLARFAIRRLLPKRAELTALTTRARELGEQRARLAERLSEQEAEFEQLRARVRAQLARPEAPADAALEPAGCGAEAAVSDEDVEMELLRRKRAGGEA